MASNDIEAATLRIIGALAQDIRGDWNSIDQRFFAMVNLAADIDRQDFVDWLNSHKSDIREDGRIFRDDWQERGWPYCTCTRADLKLIDIPTFLFSSPDGSIEDYDSAPPDKHRD